MAAIHVLDFPLFYLVGGAAGPEEGLQIIAERRLLFQIHGVLLLGFLLLMPGVLALYVAMREVNKTYMLMAVTVGLLAAIQVTWISPLVLSEVVLSDGYMAATSEAQQAAYVTATDLVRGTLGSAFFVRFSLLFLHMLVAGLVMRKGIFGRGTAYLSVVGGIVGLAGVLASSVAAATIGLGPSSAALVLAVGFAPIAILPPIWALVVGYGLYGRG